jgi:O-antigen/teichoic acid export membrane protein
LSNDKQNSKTLTHKDTRAVAFWKTIEYTGLILFLAVIPRSMGPEEYGNFAVILSLLGMFALTSALGGLAMFGRFVPKFSADDQPELIRGLFTQFFVFRLLLALPLMVLFPLLLTHLRPDIAAEVSLAAAIAYFFGTLSMSCFQLFFGQNRMGLWLFHDSSGRLLLVILLAAYWRDFDLKNAVYSLAIIECFLACPALFWARKYFDFGSAIQQLPTFVPHLKFGLAFFASNLLLMVVWRSGEVIIVSFSADSEQVAFYNLASSMFLALNALFGQVSTLLIPSVSALHASEQHERKVYWLGSMLKYITVATLLALIFINTVGEPVLVMLLGQGFSEVSINLFIISISLLPLNMVRLGLITAVVHDKLRENFIMASIAMVSFLISAVLLAPEMGARGVSISVVISAFTSAAFAYWHFRLSSISRAAGFGKIVVMGCFFVGFVMFSGYPPIVTGVVSLLAFSALLLLFRIVRISELLALITDKNRKSGIDRSV